MKKILFFLIFLAIGHTAFASQWTVQYSGGKFVISRNNSTSCELVYYKTVSISALDGVNYTGVEGSFTFAKGESSKEFNVSENRFSSLPLRYRYLGTTTVYYDVQVTDASGSLLASTRKAITSGPTINNEYYLNNYTDFVNPPVSRFIHFDNGIDYLAGLHFYDAPYTPPTADVESSGAFAGYVLIDDSYDYRYKSATVQPGYLFAINRAGVSKGWHKLIGNKLYSSVYFTEKEKNDGYAYVQILIGDSEAPYDEGYDPDGQVNTPVNSIYKACFELKKGSGVYDGTGKWIFPHSLDAHSRGEEGNVSEWTTFWLNDSYLWQQKFRSESYRAGDYNNAFILDPDIPSLTVRFDCGGKDNDTFGYKDLHFRFGLVDDTAPTVIKDSIAISPGPHLKGKGVTITIPFTEPVVLNEENSYHLHTTWGDFVAHQDCSGSNVVSFSGNITANAGTDLVIDSFEVTDSPKYPNAPIRPLKDLPGNAFGGNVYKSYSGISVGELFTITYNLQGGSVDGANPDHYSNKSQDITLINPTKEHYVFAGWTGTDLDGPTMTVTIPSESSGNRSYTAIWVPSIEGYWTGEGSQENPYVISTPEGLNHLAVLVNAGNSFIDTYFELDSDIDLSGNSPFQGIGLYESGKPFCGNFDGKGFTIRNLTVQPLYKEYGAGLFRYIQRGYVRNLTVDNATINGSNYTGVIAGYAHYNQAGTPPQFVNCVVTNCTLSGSYAGVDIGGIVGNANRCTFSECIVENCSITSGDANAVRIGGLAGDAYFCTITNCTVANCTISGNGANSTYKGAAAGEASYHAVSNLFVLNTVTDGGEIFFGRVNYTLPTPSTGFHYHNFTCADADPVSDVYTVSAGAGISVSGTAVVSYKDTNYYSSGTEITVSPTQGFTLGSVSYTPTGGVETPATNLGNGSWRFTLGPSDVSVLSSDTHIPLTPGAKDNVIAQWSTFYNGTTNHTLSGATAYTMGTDHKLYRLGTDGTTIPKGVAVVIIATSADAAFIPAGTETLNVTDHAPGGNILLGSDSAVPVTEGKVTVPGSHPAVSGTPHVLSISAGDIGFRPFTGANIPAGKAYYVVVTP